MANLDVFTIDTLLAALPARGGHFVLESGMHTDLWLDLDVLFVSPQAIQPLVAALAERLRPHSITAVCGPLLGGAFLAQLLAIELGIAFCFSEKVAPGAAGGLYSAQYEIPAALAKALHGQRVALVDDVMSAGSSVRATAKSLEQAGTTIAVVGALLVLGSVGLDHFSDQGVAVEWLGRRDLSLWAPRGMSLVRRGSAFVLSHGWIARLARLGTGSRDADAGYSPFSPDIPHMGAEASLAINSVRVSP